MGGLRSLMPISFLTYAVGMMTLSGVPFFFSGGWTKEEILHATAHWHGSHMPHYLMLAGVVLTALYMTRQMIYVFFGNRRAATESAHESPRVMTIPLIVLATCSILLAVVLVPIACVVPVTPVERALLIASVLLVIIVELLNTSVEAAIDRISFDHHSLSKRAKDIGSAAVFAALVLWGVVWALILAPLI